LYNGKYSFFLDLFSFDVYYKIYKDVVFINIKYDIDKIKNVISDFANVTRISIALVDVDLNILFTYAYNTPLFCEKLQTSPKGKQLCVESDKKLFKKGMAEKGFVSHTCRAGLTDSVMPISKNGILSGYVLFGRVREGDFFDEIYPHLRWMNADYKSLKKDYMQVACFNKSQLESISRLCSKILFENAIEIELDKSLQKAVCYIEKNIGEKLTIQSICGNCHISKNTLYRLFKEAFGCTVNEYILDKKVEKAKKLLLTTRRTIFEIGEEVGIYDAAQFSRTFKKFTNMSPKEYRQRKA